MKSIILCAPSDFGLFKAIKDALMSLGYHVYGFPMEDGNYRYKNILYRFNNLFHKTILRDKEYKNRLKLKERNILLSTSLESIPAFVDYALFIRPDMYPTEFIKKVQKRTQKCAAYHWDSMDRFPNVIKYIKLFDRFFVFNQEDATKYPSTKLTCNFIIQDDSSFTNNTSNLAYFVGSDYNNRVKETIQLKAILNSAGVTCDFTLKSNHSKNRRLLHKKGIQTIKNTIPYIENLNKVKHAKFIVDLHNQEQSGLSFRIFEALNYNKKLISTNKNLKNYDFFHPNNMFIWNGENDEELYQFLNKETIKMPGEIIDKYRLNNWIKYILDDGPYIEIK